MEKGRTKLPVALMEVVSYDKMHGDLKRKEAR
jgi:hypothetical protein